MNTLIEFLEARLREDQEAAELMAKYYPPPWNVYDRGWMARVYGGDPFWEVTQLEQGPWVDNDTPPLGEIIEHVARHDPARVLREVAAKRRVMERHSPVDVLGTLYCDGCPTDEDGFHVYELSDCPELQNLAFIWNEDEAWNQKWCPHVEGRHEEDVTEVPPARACYTNACNRCGTGDGWHYRNRSAT